VIEAVYRQRCFALAVERAGEVRGIFPLARMRGRLGGNRLVSMPYLDQGGVLAASDEEASELWRAGLRLAKRLGAAGVEARGDAPPPFSAPEHSTQRCRWVVSLEGSRDDLWRSIGPKVRNQVRKARRLGLVTRGVPIADLPRFYRLFARNMRDLGSPVHALKFFQELLTVFESRATLYLTLDADERPVAGGIALRFQDGLCVPWASSLRAARPSCPNHSLYWKILVDASRQGCRTFDFGRSTLGTGPARFKRHWGARAEPLVWTSVDPEGRPVPEAPWSARDHGLLVAIWSRLPLGVSNRLGPVVRGRLAN